MTTQPATNSDRAVDAAAFHLECVDHLCCLETEIQRANQTTSLLAKVNSLRTMLSDMLKFVDVHFPPDAARHLEEQAAKIYELSKTFEAQIQEVPGNAVSRLFIGKSRENNDVLPSAHRDLRIRLQKFVVRHFVLCVNRFDTSTGAKKTFLDSVDAFLSELDKIWD